MWTSLLQQCQRDAGLVLPERMPSLPGTPSLGKASLSTSQPHNDAANPGKHRQSTVLSLSPAAYGRQIAQHSTGVAQHLGEMLFPQKCGIFFSLLFSESQLGEFRFP